MSPTQPVAQPHQSAESLALEAFLALPDDGERHEFVRGEVRSMPPAKGDHGLIESDLLAELNRYLDARAAEMGWTPAQGREARRRLVGFVAGGEFGMRFALPDDAQQIRGADGVYVSAEQYAGVNWDRTSEYFPAVPTLVFEVISASESADDIAEKVADYLAGGARRVWCLHRRWRGIVIYDSDAPIRVLHHDGMLTDDEILPGFSLAVQDLL